MVIAKRTVIITRAKENSQEIIKELENKDFRVILEPLFQVQKLPFELKNTNPNGVLITSANACDAVIECKFNKNLPIFAVGKKTAKKLVFAGYQNIILPQEENADSLLNLLKKQSVGKNLIYFCGEKITLDFGKELENKGIVIEKVICYKMLEIENFSIFFVTKFIENKIDFILLYSQNSVDVFLRLLKKIPQVSNQRNFNKKPKLLCFSSKILSYCNSLKSELNLDFIESADFSELN